MAAAKKRVAAKKVAAKKTSRPARAKADAPLARATAARLMAEAGAEPEKKRGRAQLDGVPVDRSGGAASTYFTDNEKDIEFISAGAEVIDCALGGGWALGRVVNIVGDRSAGKTLLAIEACANFHQKFPEGAIRYAESEAAFDERYAEALGMPAGAVDYNGDDPLKTIEDWYADILRVMDANKDRPILYVLDSLDALSDSAESEREIDENSYGANKAKKLGEMFRRVVQQMEEQRVLLIVISQLRDKIGVTFGEKQTRSGGRALDFYASHIVWISEAGKITKDIDKVTRVVGVDVRLRVKKNKVGLPFRECAYPIIFGYGIDDLTASVEWLLEVGRDKELESVGISKAGYKIRIGNVRNKGGVVAREFRQDLATIVRREWAAIEKKFLPQSRKY